MKLQKDPLFSVITVNFNNLDGLRKTVNSVLEQETDTFELIVVDGASEDGSVEYLQKRSSEIFIILSELDNGIYDAMNKGLHVCGGRFVIFMNSGDCFADPHVLSRVGSYLERAGNDFDFIYGDAFEITPGGRKQMLKITKSHLMAWYGMFAHHQSMFFSTRIIKEHGLIYNEKYRLAADWDFVVRYLGLVEDGRKILNLDFPIACFETGGVSSNYITGIKEQFRIRRATLDWGVVRCSMLAFLHFALNITRNHLPSLYVYVNKLRAKKHKRHGQT